MQDSYTVLLNLILIFLVLFYVYPLKFLFTMLFSGVTHEPGLEPVALHDSAVLMKIYGIGFASVFALFVMMYRHAYALRKELDLDPVELMETRISTYENLAMMLFGPGFISDCVQKPSFVRLVVRADWSVLLDLWDDHGQAAPPARGKIEAQPLVIRNQKQ